MFINLWNLVVQDVFLSGFVKSATDFQVYKEVANLSGLDFAFMENVAVYHTKVNGFMIILKEHFHDLGDELKELLIPLISIFHCLSYVMQNDKLELLTPGSLQHLGENVLALLLEAAASDKLPLIGSNNSKSGVSSKMESVYFDILVSDSIVGCACVRACV